MSFYSGKIIKETKKKRAPWVAIFLVLLTLVLLGGFMAIRTTGLWDRAQVYRCYWNSSLSMTAFSDSSSIKTITIVSGEDPLKIGQKLQENGVIANANDFLCYVRKIDAGSKIQAGYYEISVPISLEQLVPLLQSAQIQTVRVTIPEGLRLDEVAIRLENALTPNNSRVRFSADEFLQRTADPTVVNELSYAKNKKTLEGFLFPDTYEIAKNASTQEVIDLLTDNFTKRITTSAPLATSKTLSPYEVVILASILEKEANRNYEEKQTIAGILLKRMKNGWLLQVDATLLYQKRDWKATITTQDTKIDHPYNTYTRKGLPPTPICNPGIESLKAVLNPKESAYWFYLHGKDGTVRYAKTHDEHLQNISLYLR